MSWCDNLWPNNEVATASKASFSATKELGRSRGGKDWTFGAMTIEQLTLLMKLEINSYTSIQL